MASRATCMIRSCCGVCALARGGAACWQRTSLPSLAPFLTLPPHCSTFAPPACSYTFHYIVERGVTYLCLTDEKNKRRLPFAFLDDIKAKFQANYPHERIAVAIAFSMNAEFSRIMEDRLNYFNDNPNADSFGKVKGQLEEVKGVMVDNIEKVRLGGGRPWRPWRPALPPGSQGPSLPAPCSPPLASQFPSRSSLLPVQVLARGEKIELLVDKTEALNQSAKKFQKSAKNLKNAMWCVGNCFARNMTVRPFASLASHSRTLHPFATPAGGRASRCGS